MGAQNKDFNAVLQTDLTRDLVLAATQTTNKNTAFSCIPFRPKTGQIQNSTKTPNLILENIEKNIVLSKSTGGFIEW